MNTILAVLGLGAGAIFLYEAFAPKTVTTKYGNKITLYTYRGVPYHVWMTDHSPERKEPLVREFVRGEDAIWQVHPVTRSHAS